MVSTRPPIRDLVNQGNKLSFVYKWYEVFIRCRFLRDGRHDNGRGRWNNVQKQVIDTAHGLFNPAGKSINEWGRLSCLLLVKDNCRCGFLRDGWNDSVGGRRGINP